MGLDHSPLNSSSSNILTIDQLSNKVTLLIALFNRIEVLYDDSKSLQEQLYKDITDIFSPVSINDLFLRYHSVMEKFGIKWSHRAEMLMYHSRGISIMIDDSAEAAYFSIISQ